MQVPERIALLGGTILLSSTLIFTLKSQASKILPQIHDNVSSIGDEFYMSNTERGLAYAKKHPLKQGHWGTADYYLDSQNHLYVEGGKLNGKLTDVLGSSRASMVQSIDFADDVQAPPVSAFLFSASDGQHSSLTTINGLEKVDTSQVTDMSNLFTNDTQLRSLDLSHWDVSSVHDLAFAFFNMKSLNYLDVSTWNTSHVQSLNSIFANDISTGVLNLNNWNTSNVTDMSFAFLNNWALSGLSVSKWDTRNVTSIQGMFSGDGTYTYLDVSDWDTRSLQNTSYAFANNFALQHLDLTRWDQSQISQRNGMFANDDQLRLLGKF